MAPNQSPLPPPPRSRSPQAVPKWQQGLKEGLKEDAMSYWIYE